MRLAEVAELLDADVLVGRDRLALEVPVAGAADMLSDVLLFGRSGMLLLTGLIKPSVVRAAQVADIAAVVFVRGKQPDPETIEMAEDHSLPLMVTAHSMYDSCGRLYVRGLPGVIAPRGDGARHQ